MSTLEVPGACLYYETHGSGPLIALIAGAAGTGDVYAAITPHLAARYTVVRYDRRGFSRSRLDGPQDYGHRLETDAGDVRHLIEYLSEEPAIVFGASSGAIVGLELLARHPSVVRALVPYEPPMLRMLAEGDVWGAKWPNCLAGTSDSSLTPQSSASSSSGSSPKPDHSGVMRCAERCRM